MMNRTAQAAVAVLVLVVGGAIGLRSIRTATPASTEPARLPVAQVAVPPTSTLTGAPCGSLTLRWVGILQGRLAAPKPASTAAEMSQSQEREIHDELRKRLGEEPVRWTDVLESLCEEDPRLGRKIVGELQDAVGDGGEKALLPLLKSGRHRETRMSAASLVAGRSSTESLWALVHCAQEDPDSGVRYQALFELAKRKGRAVSTQESDTIDQVLRQRGQVEPDLAVRQFAQRAGGQPVEPASTSAAPRGFPRPR